MDDFLGGPDREQRSAEMHASLMEFLTESESMRKTAKSSLKQSMYAGGGAFAGSFIGGPVGGLIGGIAGSLVGFFQSDGYDGLLLAVSKIDDTHRTHLLKVSVRIKEQVVRENLGILYRRRDLAVACNMYVCVEPSVSHIQLSLLLALDDVGKYILFVMSHQINKRRSLPC